MNDLNPGSGREAALRRTMHDVQPDEVWKISNLSPEVWLEILRWDSCYCLVRYLAPKEPVLNQQERWITVFDLTDMPKLKLPEVEASFARLEASLASRCPPLSPVRVAITNRTYEKWINKEP